MKYRPEIDGLRAVAVGAVVVYHAALDLKNIVFFPGGFLGVDIFFVISGYLITSILLRELGEGTYSLAGFYERRARRILPALLAIIAIITPFAFVLMLPKAFDEYTRSMLWTLAFGSNFFFWLEDSYTAVGSAFKPLLHTWSLAIEEQFYVFFPLLLAFLWKRARAWTGHVIAAVFILSLVLAQGLNYTHADAAFYLLPTRAWELAAGALLAWLEIEKKSVPDARARAVLPSLGLLLIAGPLLFYTDTMRHPGFLTLVPVVGAMMVIRYGGGADIASRLLSWKLAVFVGLISYSLYLWHQPVFALAAISSNLPLSDVEKIGLMGVCFVLAVVSWHFIEKPFRNRARMSLRRAAATFAATTAALVLLCAAQISLGVKSHFTNVSPYAAEALDLKYVGYLFKNTPCRGDGKPYCVRGPKDAAERWVVLGDSHLDRVAPVLWDRVKARGAQMIFMIEGGCGYAPGLETIVDGKPDTCTSEINARREEYLLSLPPSRIVVFGRYNLYIEGTWFDNGEGGIEDTGFMLMQPAGYSGPGDARIGEVQDSIAASLQRLLDAGHEIVLVYPVPEMGWNVPERFNKMAKTMQPDEIEKWVAAGGMSTDYRLFVKRNRATYETFDRLGAHERLFRVRPEELFCHEQEQPGRCVSAAGGKILYNDDDHLSRAGADLLVEEILKAAGAY